MRVIDLDIFIYREFQTLTDRGYIIIKLDRGPCVRVPNIPPPGLEPGSLG